MAEDDGTQFLVITRPKERVALTRTLDDGTEVESEVMRRFLVVADNADEAKEKVQAQEEAIAEQEGEDPWRVVGTPKEA